VTGRQGRKSSQLLDNFKETKWYRNLKEEGLDRALVTTPYGRGYGPVTLDRDVLIGIATRYGLYGPGIESRWGRDFPHSPGRFWCPSSLLYSVHCILL
jgi:hypothetical protein